MKLRLGLLLIILAAIFTFPAYLFSQHDTMNNKNHLIIKTDILMPIAASFSDYRIGSLTFEKCFSKRHSIQITGVFRYYHDESNEYYKIKNEEKTFQIVPEYKYFFSKRKTFSGFYGGAFLKFQNYREIKRYYISIPNNRLKSDEFSLSVGLNIGYQIYLWHRLTFDFLFGTGYRVIKPNRLSSFDGRLVINIGYKF